MSSLAQAQARHLRHILVIVGKRELFGIFLEKVYVKAESLLFGHLFFSL